MGKEEMRLFENTYVTLDKVWDRSTNTFFEPYNPSLEEQIKELEKLREKTGLINTPPSTVAVIDTGILSNHPLLRDKIAESKDFTGENNPEDTIGHGTLVALILVKTNPNVRILNIKVMDKKRKIEEKWVIEGIRYAIQKKALIINLSLGYSDSGCDEHPQLRQAVKEAVDENIIVCVAGEARCPGEVEGVIRVGGLTSKGVIPTPLPPDVVAPGEFYMRPMKDYQP